MIFESTPDDNELVSPASLGGEHSSQEVIVQGTPCERVLGLVDLQGGHGLDWNEQVGRGSRLSQRHRRRWLRTLQGFGFDAEWDSFTSGVFEQRMTSCNQ